jgi:hypothetical protein
MSHGDDTIQIINLADNINAAFDKINENFELLDAGLTRDEVIALITEHLNGNPHFDESAIRAFLKDADLDIGNGKITYSNNYATFGELPDASSYHGMFAHVHNPPAAYYAHGGQWIELANKSDVGSSDFDGDYNSLTNRPSIPTDLDDLSDVQFSSQVLIGHVLKWDGTKWTNLEDASGGGGGPTDPGENGTSFYQATIYQRSPTQPTTPSGGTFDFPTATLTPPSDWEGTIPTGDDDLWACNFLFRDYLSQQGTITATDWSEPYRLAGLIDVNSNGESYAQLSIYRRWSPPEDGSEPVLLAPDGGSFDFDPSVENPLTPPNDWYLTPPSVDVQAGDLYVSAGIATTNGLDEGVTLDTSISWSNPQKTSTGLDGQDGRSIFEKAVYRRVQKPAGWSIGDDLPAPPKPVGGFFNFGEEVFGKTAPDIPAPLDDADGNTGVWYAGVPTWDPTSGEPAGDVWSSVYAFSVVGDTGTDIAVDENWSEPTIGILDSVSTYRKSLYARSATRPTTDFSNNNVIYSFTHDKFLTIGPDTDAVNGIDGLPFWYEEPPELDLDDPMDLWEVTTTASLIGYLGEDRDLTFGDIKRVLNYAIDAEDGFSFVQLNVYQWASTNPGEPPSDGTFDFSSKTFTVPTGWYRNVPDPDPNDGPLTLYVSSGVASTLGLTEADNNVDSNIEWSTADATTAGGSGRDGRSTFRAVIVTRTNDVPVSDGGTLVPPTGGVVNFAGTTKTGTSQELSGANVGGNTSFPPNSVTPPVGWYDHVSDIPATLVPDGKVWAVEQTFAIDGDDSIDVGGTWSEPYEDHNNGEDGYSTFSASVYKRSAVKPAADGSGEWGPVGATYSFTDDVVVFTNQNITDGWSEDPQESNDAKDPLWLCRATATTKGLTGTDATLTWSEPVKVSSDGENGQPGSGIVVDLSNENHSITAQFDGTLYSNSLFGAFTTLQAFNGDDAIDLSNETIDISLSEGVSQGSGPNDVNWTTADLSTSITHVGANVDEFTLTFTVLNRSAVFTLTKIKAAAPGQPATVYRLINSASVIKSNPNNTEHEPSQLFVTAFKYTGGLAPAIALTGTTLILKTNDVDTVVESATDGTLIWDVADNTTSINVELWVPDTSGVKVDEENIPVVFDGTDSGDVTVPPRFESGYVYYQVADGSTNGPAKPSANSFTFAGAGGNSGTDGVFVNLTDDWSANPPGDTNLEGTFWAARFTAFEDTAGGGTATGDATTENGNLHFSTPFKNFSFNGLVTFENLSDELVNMDDQSSRITTIDGGKITTGELDADKVEIRKLSAKSGVGGARSEISQDGVKVYSAGNNGQGVLRVKLGDLS